MAAPPARRTKRVATAEEIEAAWWAHQLGIPPDTATSPKLEAMPDVLDRAAVGGEMEQTPAFRVVDPVRAGGGKVDLRSPANRPDSYGSLDAEPRKTILTQLIHQVNAIRYSRQGRCAIARQALGYLLLTCLTIVLAGALVEAMNLWWRR
jgi:hypothetical protein